MTSPSHPLPHAADERPGASVIADFAQDPRASARVLVVDDDEAVGLVLSRTLTKLGYTSDLAPDGQRALDLFNLHPEWYSLVLLDYKLPGMDSRTVFRGLRRRRPDVPVILMSGYSREDALANSAGMDLAGFLHKPFTRESLASALGCVGV
jgi:two-component system cell cycle sensor histidine kinase/response regulator CckA